MSIIKWFVVFFAADGYKCHHYYNEVYGECIDATIDQFNKCSSAQFSPYDNYDNYYEEKKRTKVPLNREAPKVKDALESFGALYWGNRKITEKNMLKKRW